MANIFKGIDVSNHQGTIDWAKVKPAVDFAILRCGYGRDLKGQDDTQFTRNMTECEKRGIPYGVYLYSYATSVERIDSEVAHTLRLIKGHKPFCVYIDMEDSSTISLGKANLTAFAKRFCEAVKAKGYKPGVYANQNWFQTYLDVAALSKAGYSIWCAKYSENKPNIAAKYDIWQYSSKGKVAGIGGNVDMNYMYNDIRGTEKATEKPAAKKETKKGYTGTFPKLPAKGYIEKGDEGTQVRNLQKFLNWYGPDIKVDGDFGPKTDAAVRAYQKKEKLTIDGKFGVKSLAKAKMIKK